MSRHRNDKIGLWLGLLLAVVAWVLLVALVRAVLWVIR